VNSIDEFVRLLHDELGLAVTKENVADDWDDLPGWDSLYLLSLLGILERETKRPLSLPEVLEATSLQQVYVLAVGE
jgi:hypothetical protein